SRPHRSVARSAAATAPIAPRIAPAAILPVAAKFPSHGRSAKSSARAAFPVYARGPLPSANNSGRNFCSATQSAHRKPPCAAPATAAAYDSHSSASGRQSLVKNTPHSASTCAHRHARRSTCPPASVFRSEEHTSELQSRFDLVCRLLLEKKKHKISP